MALRLIMIVTLLAWHGVAMFAHGGDPATKPERKTIQAADGLSIACDIRGKGDTALVFLHGWGGDREYWKHQAEAFATDYTVVTVDQAGHGESGTNRKTWTVDGLSADVETTVKHLGLKRVILIGHSMGGPVSLLAAKRLRGKVIGVVGVDTLQDAELKRPEALVKTITTGMEKDFKGMVTGMFGGMLAEKSDPKLKEWLGTKAAARDPEVVVPLMKDLFALDQVKALQGAGVPVRCVNSGGGYQYFTVTAVATNRKYADYDAVTISDVGHYPMLEKPTEFNEKLRAVLKPLMAGK